MIEREQMLGKLRGLLKRHPVVAILGARQVGKTTLARMLAARWGDTCEFFDLENPADQARLSEPMLALQELTGLVVIDEVQHLPGLFPVLRVLADRPDEPCRFLLLGSASPELLQQSSESLAGRIHYLELDGFSIDEVGIDHARELWLRGGMPRSYLARSEAASYEWREGFIRTFLERDLPQLGSQVSSATMGRFWRMLAHYHAQTWNASEFGRAFGVADTTVRNYLDCLESALVVRQLQPWHENLSKRQVKAPKVYIKDSGLVHALLRLPEARDVESHPKVGATWEGFWLDQVVRHLGVSPGDCFYWATYAGAELDLLVIRGSTRLGFEFKRTVAPSVTKSMRIALDDLKLHRLDVIHAGDKTFPLGEGIRAVAGGRMLDDIQPLVQ